MACVKVYVASAGSAVDQLGLILLTVHSRKQRTAVLYFEVQESARCCFGLYCY